MLSLALTHYNRFSMLCEAIAAVIDDPRIDEIVISDDASTDGSYERLLERYGKNPRVRLSQNRENVDCYRNKARAVELARGPWVILFDSDNVMTPTYLDAIGKLDCRRDTAYLPVFAEPHFNYTAFEGWTIDRHNVAEVFDRPLFDAALNTANYLVHRDEYLRVWDDKTDPGTADSIYQNLRWLRAGNRLHFVPGLRYFHRVHAGSHYILNNRGNGLFRQSVEGHIRRLR